MAQVSVNPCGSRLCALFVHWQNHAQPTRLCRIYTVLGRVVFSGAHPRSSDTRGCRLVCIVYFYPQAHLRNRLMVSFFFSGWRRLILGIVFCRPRRRRQGFQGDRLGPVLQLGAPEPDQRHVLCLICHVQIYIAWSLL